MSSLSALVTLFVDKALYVERFAAKLMLGNKTTAGQSVAVSLRSFARHRRRLNVRLRPQVSNTAMRVLARLKRDWLQTGRRPSGITGAALYIAAHLHGLQPNMADLVREMHVCDATLRRRVSIARRLRVARF